MTSPFGIQTQPVRLRDGHDNFFTPLRLIFALMVVVGHAFVISGGGSEHEPLILFGYSASYLAVNLFFVASGYMVTASMLRRGDGPNFLAARFIRIYPALIVHVGLIMFVVGPLASSLPLSAYLATPSLWLEPFKVLSFVDTDLVLPGAFEQNGEQLASAPLWTLRYEVLCYIATLAAFSLGLMRRRWMVLLQFVAPAIIWIVAVSNGLFDTMPASIEAMVRFSLAYGMGAVAYAYKDRIQLRWSYVPLLFGLSWLCQGTAIGDVAIDLMVGIVVLLLAFAHAPNLERFQSIEDVSYGVYIYHWPVMQLLVHWMPGIGTAELLAFALPIILTLSWASWTYVEKPMLRYKTPLGQWLRFGRPEPVLRPQLTD
ncbi:MAG: acyltransferase [Litorimonas sp.]